MTRNTLGMGQRIKKSITNYLSASIKKAIYSFILFRSIICHVYFYATKKTKSIFSLITKIRRKSTIQIVTIKQTEIDPLEKQRVLPKSDTNEEYHIFPVDDPNEHDEPYDANKFFSFYT
ncbi:hypothetical protein NEFER03_0689 [Nematocida sp. LUAm3]|nr:hypothetical protein NEFER03_0689 [Nematocida sp. LUAm3]KAI5175148.1 hypothetical protein NEFER02_1109 [Nematocida sp. LUAm2]KAI5178180.1 hypothetical protein NEFER01_1358 [Nematocida sp. LUAm1]